ncbi:hypothetical protein [Aquimarina sp. MMG016]|uniref:hypothetical protein n=1 Tax=Aquimarina sp. MMG016 TaxID=2822690 RepID=UPI001B3A3EFC|nr:hypothetical protein [Aquimarina sp. MMG016]MBQ4821985.1 hypothetical protein [Aquimarina sp. MMG016]
MEEENKAPRKTWDLMIGITLVLLGSFRLYNRFQAESEWTFRSLFTIVFIIFGGYLIFRYLQNPDKKD